MMSKPNIATARAPFNDCYSILRSRLAYTFLTASPSLEEKENRERRSENTEEAKHITLVGVRARMCVYVWVSVSLCVKRKLWSTPRQVIMCFFEGKVHYI